MTKKTIVRTPKKGWIRPPTYTPFRLGVVADDLTGAGDVSLALSSLGPVEIGLVGPQGYRSPAPETRVWVLDTESRHLPGRESFRRVLAAVRRLQDWRAGFFFKKIDSTLRGPLAEELSAFFQAVKPSAPVAVVPAFPHLGRTVREGLLRVNGLALEHTPFAQDPRHPMTGSRVMDYLPLVKDQVWVPDVADQRALTRMAQRMSQVPVGVGSAGWAGALARAWGLSGIRRVENRPQGLEPVGVVRGSAHPLSLRQEEVLLRHSFPGGVVPLLFSAPRRRGQAGPVLRRLVKEVASLGHRPTIRRWVVTGGETAVALAHFWGLRRWRWAGRVEAGVSLIKSQGQPSLWLALKPGGFGDEKSLVRAVSQLMGVS